MHNLKRLLILFICISFLATSRAISAQENKTKAKSPPRPQADLSSLTKENLSLKKKIEDLEQTISRQNKAQLELQKQLTFLNEKAAALERGASILEAMLNQQREIKPPSLVRGDEKSWDKVVHLNLGFAYAMKGKITQAIEEYKKALEYDPEDKDIHYNLGYLLAKRNRYKEAIEEYKKAIKGSAEDKEAYYNLSVIYATIIKDQELANQYYQKSLNK
jgi:tetratricopeptide (TPR) repeat protein